MIFPLLIATLRPSSSTLAAEALTPFVVIVAVTDDVELFNTIKYVLPPYFRQVARSAEGTSDAALGRDAAARQPRIRLDDTGGRR